MWVEPRVVVEVSYSEIMVGRLRDPVLRGLGTARGGRARPGVADAHDDAVLGFNGSSAAF